MLNKVSDTKLLSINERIKLIMDRQGLGDKALAGAMGLTRGRVSQIFKAGVWDNMKQLKVVADFLGYPVAYLISGKEEDLIDTEVEFTPTVVSDSAVAAYLDGKNIRPITVTVSPSGQELVTYVPVKAQAGYMKGYGDPHFIEHLPAFTLPGVVKDATFRMFEVDGDSMLQLGNKGLRNGEIVIARYVEDIFDMKDNRVYVVISTEGTAIKRVINRLRDKDTPCLVMASDNKNGQHPNYILKPKQIKEVWEAKRYISGDFSFDTNLYEIIGDLQAEQAKLKLKVDELGKTKP